MFGMLVCVPFAESTRQLMFPQVGKKLAPLHLSFLIISFGCSALSQLYGSVKPRKTTTHLGKSSVNIN